MGSVPDPELDVAAGAMVEAGAHFVVIGSFAVTAHGLVRAGPVLDFLIPDDLDNDRRILAALRHLDAVRLCDEQPLREEHLLGKMHARAITSAGVIDVIRCGPRPLDFETVVSGAIVANYDGLEFPVAGLSSVVAFKRLAGRPRDLLELGLLEEIHGELPIEPIPGLDS